MGNKQANINNEYNTSMIKANENKLETNLNQQSAKQQIAHELDNRVINTQMNTQINTEENTYHRMQVQLTMGFVEPLDGIYAIQILLQNTSKETPQHKLLFKVKVRRSDHIRMLGVFSTDHFRLTFKDTAIIDYLFECNQKLIFYISLIKDGKRCIRSVLKRAILIGKLMGSKGQSTELSIAELCGERSKFFIIAKEVERNKSQVEIRVVNKVKLGIGKVYFTIKKEVINNKNIFAKKIKEEDRLWIEFYKSEVVDLNKNFIAEYKLITLESTVAYFGNVNNPTLIEFFDFTHKKIIGKIEFTFNDLLNKKGILNHFVNEGKSDELEIDLKVRVYDKLTFIDYLKKGMQIALAIGIDFTASNKDYKLENSNHYIQQDKLNCYEQAIKYCGQILAYYDYDQVYPVYGFGALVLGEKIVDNCFSVNLNMDPNIRGIYNVLANYRRCLKNIKFYGPTCFAPIINKMISEIRVKIKSVYDYLEYNVLLILTDGNVSDLEESVEGVITASKYPISIIIIGIGTGPFDKMDALDADVSPLVDKHGRKMERDIVQFVEFDRFKDDDEELIREVLAEIPTQIVEYYAMTNVMRKHKVKERKNKTLNKIDKLLKQNNINAKFSKLKQDNKTDNEKDNDNAKSNLLVENVDKNLQSQLNNNIDMIKNDNKTTEKKKANTSYKDFDSLKHDSILSN